MNPFEPDPNKPLPLNPFAPAKPRTSPPNLFDILASKPVAPRGLANLFELPKKPRLFISYHHKNDQRWYDRFSKIFAGTYDLFSDTSIDRKIDSDDPDYQSRKIREDHITGSSITVLLLGAETWKRKHVDWEIHSTLEKEHALLGLILPTRVANSAGDVIVPGRFHDNFQSGFAHMVTWSENPAAVAAAIAAAKLKARNTHLIRNSRAQFLFNRS